MKTRTIGIVIVVAVVVVGRRAGDRLARLLVRGRPRAARPRRRPCRRHDHGAGRVRGRRLRGQAARGQLSSAPGVLPATPRPPTSRRSRRSNPDAQVVGVACEDTEEDAVGFMKEFGLTYPLVMDDGTLVQEFGITGLSDDDLLRRAGERGGPPRRRRHPRPVRRLAGEGAVTRPPRADGPAPAPPMTAVEITSLSLTAIGLAFAAGLLSFVSPCVLPLLPVYLSFISGVGVERPRARARRRLLLDLAALRRRVHRGLRAHGRRRRRRRPAARRVPPRADDRRRRLHRLQRPRRGRLHPAARAGAEGGAQAGRRRRRVPHRRRARHRLDAVRRLRARRHPLHGRDQPERALGLPAPARLLARAGRALRARGARLRLGQRETRLGQAALPGHPGDGRRSSSWSSAC